VLPAKRLHPGVFLVWAKMVWRQQDLDRMIPKKMAKPKPLQEKGDGH